MPDKRVLTLHKDVRPKSHRAAAVLTAVLSTSSRSPALSLWHPAAQTHAALQPRPTSMYWASTNSRAPVVTKLSQSWSRCCSTGSHSKLRDCGALLHARFTYLDKLTPVVLATAYFMTTLV